MSSNSPVCTDLACITAYSLTLSKSQLQSHLFLGFGGEMHDVRGASKIKLKNVNKKRMATARRLIFLEFLKAPLADLITMLVFIITKL
jgi:hypothetical protein